LAALTAAPSWRRGLPSHLRAALLLLLVTRPPESAAAASIALPISHDPGSLAGDSLATSPDSTRGFDIRGYGVVNYFAFDWDTDPGRRNKMDVERLTLYPSYRLNTRFRLDAEIEFEHGGTGVTLEFDPLEEFGEFEQEVEKGGEVLLEQLNVSVAFEPEINLRVGRLKVPFGLQSVNDEPTEYFTTTRSESESNIVPVNWYEDGLQLWGALGERRPLVYVLSLVNGLDSSAFSSSSWVVRGNQKRFEQVNAEDLALAARLDYEPLEGARVGVSGYYGDSADNRPKPDLQADAHVGIVSGYGSFERGPLVVRGLVIYGHLENADLVSTANRNLSNELNVKRTPVGSEAFGWYVEGGYDVLELLARSHQQVVVFGRLDRYDTMAAVTGDVFDNPRWDRTVYTAGFNWLPIEEVVVKGQYAHRELGTDTANDEETFSLGIGFEF
jgi:hypothetical protein